MKIAIDVLSIREDGSAGGATGFAIELIKGFAEVSGVQVLVLCADWNIKLLKTCLPGNVQFCQVAGEKRYTGVAKIDRKINYIMRKLHSGALLAQNKVDILYCPFSAATFKEKGIPTVSTILDIQHEFYPQFFEPQELQHRRNFYQDIVKKVERVVCISDYTRQTFCEKYGYPEDRAQTIYIAIQNRFQIEDDKILDKLKIRNEKYIVYPANFWEHKNHKLLLNAFAMYAYEHKDLKLVLTGNPLNQTEYYNELLSSMKIQDRTIITGYITNEELYSILKNAKGLIYPSLFEGFGIPVVEAMYLNKLIACSDLTSLPEIGCEAIYYFNPKKPDEILNGIQFLAENEMTDVIAKEYIENLKKYKTDKMVQDYLAVFHDVIEKREDLEFDQGITGIYTDGWSGPEIAIQIKNEAGGRVKVKLTLPEFVDKAIKFALHHNGKTQKFKVNPGSAIEIEEAICKEEDRTEIKICCLKTWSPKTLLKNEDMRELGLMVDEMTLITAADNVIDLRNEN